MEWIVIAFFGLAAVLLFLGAVKIQRREDDYMDDDGVTFLEDDNENSRRS